MFPNVALANQPDEAKKLENKYKKAKNEAVARNCDGVFNDFEAQCQDSTAVCCYDIQRVHKQLNSDIFANYGELESLRLRTSSTDGIDYERKRPQAEIELLGNSKHVNEIHYAALSLDGTGLSSYGNCALELDEDMTAHRSSCFDGNSAIIFFVSSNFVASVRSDWENRAKLCAAARAEDLTDSTQPADFPGLLCKCGDTAEDDVFIEVHIFGTMTIHTLKSVTVNKAHRRYKKGRDDTYLDVIAECLSAAGVPLKIA